MNNRILLIDDDATFCQVLAQSLTRRGYEVGTATTAGDALGLLSLLAPANCVLDLRMPEQSGLQLIPALLAVAPKLRIVVLTGYASIATAVEAIKLGAIHYLTKPTDVDEVIQAFDRAHGDQTTTIQDHPTSLERLEWEYIQKVLNECEGNVSSAAKRLGLHRRTLQRKLQKRPSGIA